MTNYMGLKTVAATAENLVESMTRDQKNHPDPKFVFPGTGNHIGPNPSWEQKLVFEWAFMTASFRKIGQHAFAEISRIRLNELIYPKEMYKKGLGGTRI